ncbi:MAG: vacuolar membrane-associated protein iml1 [Thelocarpon impressellum]|nr:MAG: vacuolar membrane-associated protein iml1 [Thelocarpon impressellum]
MVAFDDTGSPGSQAVVESNRAQQRVGKLCTLWVHEENFSKEEVILNATLFPAQSVKLGELAEIVAVKPRTSSRDFQESGQRVPDDEARPDESTGGSGRARLGEEGENRTGSTSYLSPDEEPVEGHRDEPNRRKRYVFLVKDMSNEQKSKQPNLQVDAALNTASHVEIAFRDEYLARADMWRLAIAELSSKTVYKGQKILFMGTIKAQVKHVYVRGKKVQSAYFSASTRPVFRSESARYVLLIQMSNEMWDFDSDASGEIMFNRIISGFLPELFKRWMSMNARHLISIVLFTRVEYDSAHATALNGVAPFTNPRVRTEPTGQEKCYKDFYRVVVSEMTSGDWVTIIDQLKKEFKVFRRDISIQRNAPEPSLSSRIDQTVPEALVLGQPSAAIHGNLLEAINLACSQFATDYIDRDLVRTGISIVVVTPGTGIFEVEYEMLRTTTDTLINNGISIDLVCLTKMPLHSVPLFRYRNPSVFSVTDAERRFKSGSGETTPRQLSPALGSFSSPHGLSLSPSKLLTYTSSPKKAFPDTTPGKWTYAVPHWMDISFWAGSSSLGLPNVEDEGSSNPVYRVNWTKRAGFVPRVKMYELQMMGIMENEMSNISVPYLRQSPFHPEQLHPISTRRKRITTSNQDGGYLSNGSPPNGRLVGPGNVVTTHSFSRAEQHRLISKEDRELHGWMDVYDDHVFRPLSYLQAAEREARRLRAKEEEHSREADSLIFGTSYKKRSRSPPQPHTGPGTAFFDRKMRERQLTAKTTMKREGSVDSLFDAAARPPRRSRQFSSGLRLLGAAPPKATASTQLRTENATPGPVLRHELSAKLAFQSPKADSQSITPQSPRTSEGGSMHSDLSVPDVGMEAPRKEEKIGRTQPSNPIAIKRSATIPEVGGRSDGGSAAATTKDLYLGSRGQPERIDVLQAASKTKQAGPKFDLSSVVPVTAQTLSPTNALAPWLTFLNPSNPRKHNVGIDNEFSRWQHVFPRPIRASTMKWKSLCSPAAIPLTTETFPTAEQLATEYQENPYNVSQNEDEEAGETATARDNLIKELIALRLSQGFQLVVGAAVAESIGQPSLELANLFDSAYMAEDGAMVVMSKGNSIHQLQCIEGNEVEVKRFVRKPATAVTGLEGHMKDGGPVFYSAMIRTALSQSYEPRDLVFQITREEYNWNYVDSFIAGYEEQFTEHLRFWRARFVLIPVEQPQSVRRRLHGLSEDNEEEIRLEGIRKLTQMWQRHRHVPLAERHFPGPQRQRKDTNPLDIVYQTRDPSAVIAAELDGLPLVDTENVGRRSQLFSEMEQFQRASLSYTVLAQEIQGEKGIQMQDRRWHLRLHYNCFIGFEMTTWLLENFRDVETREAAVELGNELMRGGLFQHVEKRHQFRDGNYFYQIASEYRAPRPDSRRGWFGTRKPDRSIPSTPLHDTPASTSRADASRGSEDGVDVNNESSSGTPTVPGSRKLRVALSKVMRYDVDHRKRSYRPELINLHYDRLHNPDNCYHVRIDWMNVTAKLIEDAIVAWATTADKYGLKLVEVPVGEASSISKIHPFRSPYRVKLASPPPSKRPEHYFDATSFSPLVESDRHFYHKALMKKFNFVLDVEAALNFPPDVDVTYSWGKPDYRYTQYIHRSGVLLAQVTDDGDFLLLANRLCNIRTAANPDKYEKSDHQERRTANPPSPFASPLVRAAPEALKDGTVGGRECANSGPVRIKDELEGFCQSPQALARFYDEILSRATSPGPNTPMLDASIPVLGLPPSMRDLSPSPTSNSTGNAAGKSPSNSSPRGSLAESH